MKLELDAITHTNAFLGDASASGLIKRCEPLPDSFGQARLLFGIVFRGHFGNELAAEVRSLRQFYSSGLKLVCHQDCA